MFDSLYKRGLDKHSQLCIYYRGRVVVDLYGYTHSKKLGFNADKLVSIFSCGKSIGAILMAVLRD